MHLPKVLSEHAFQLHYNRPIGLGKLQTRWKHQVEDDEFWREKTLVGWRPICSRWFFDFDHTMVARVRVDGNPADVFTTDADDSSKRLSITFNEAAIQEIGYRLHTDIKQYKMKGAQSEALWELRSLVVSIAHGSPFANMISVFHPRHQSHGRHFETEANELILLLDELWPVIFIMLTNLCSYATYMEADGSFRDAKEEDVWSELYYPFYIPPTLQKMGRREFDPSWEYSAHLLAFLSDDQDRMTAWREDISAKLEDLGDHDGDRVWVGWAMTVWESPTPLDDEDMIDRTLRIGLHSDNFKVVSYFNKLASAILEAIHLKSAAFAPEELRRVVYQYHALKQKLAERKRLLDEFEVGYFRKLNALSDLHEYLGSDQYLGDLMIKAAEGLEIKADQHYERKIQFIAIFFTVLTLAALGMDGYNFVQGSANEPVATAVDRWLFIMRLGLVICSVIGLVSFAIGGKWGVNLAGRLWRRLAARDRRSALMRP